MNLVHDGEAAPESEKLVVRERSWSLSKMSGDDEEEEPIEMEEEINDKPENSNAFEMGEPIVEEKVIVQPIENALMFNEKLHGEELEAVYEENPAVPLPQVDNENYPETLSLKLIPDTLLNSQIPAQVFQF